jgi:uncharacterized OB-fold protein
MTQGKTRVPAVEGWFTDDEEHPRLLGSRCTSCGTFFFPRATSYCRNPDCDGTEFDEVPLSGRGKVWSFTANRYQPPPPYVAADPWEPYAIAAVELAEERMVVLGQMVPEVDLDELHIGMEVELVLGPLYDDDEHTFLVWKWRPTKAAR